VAPWKQLFAELRQALVDGYLPAACLACGADTNNRGFCAPCLELVGDGPPFLYRGPVAQAIQRGKYSSSQAARLSLASMFAAAAKHSKLPITFIPAHWSRRAWRGFDFPAELAHALGQRQQTPVIELLRAKRRDPRLATLESASERAAVVLGRFVATPLAHNTKDVVLVDDVFTTGATMAEAVRVLGEVGCTAHPLTLARAP
jgi:predicted amidophosphoribosyltransferase